MSAFGGKADITRTCGPTTGLSEDDLTKQLSQVLPGVINGLTPNGKLPTVAELWPASQITGPDANRPGHLQCSVRLRCCSA